MTNITLDEARAQLMALQRKMAAYEHANLSIESYPHFLFFFRFIFFRLGGNDENH